MTVLLSFARLYTDDLDGLLDRLQRLGLPEPRTRFAIPEAGLELAGIGDVLVVAGSAAAVAPYRDTSVTFVVDDLEEAVAHADRVVREITAAPTGRNATVLLAGVQVELVEWSPEQWERWNAAAPS